MKITLDKKTDVVIKQTELSFTKSKTLLYFALWPCIAVVTYVLGLGIQNKINFVYMIAAIAYVALIYIVSIAWFGRETNKLLKSMSIRVKNLEEKDGEYC